MKSKSIATKPITDYYPYADGQDKTRAYKASLISAIDNACHPAHLKRAYMILDKLKQHMESEIS